MRPSLTMHIAAWHVLHLRQLADDITLKQLTEDVRNSVGAGAAVSFRDSADMH